MSVPGQPDPTKKTPKPGPLKVVGIEAFWRLMRKTANRDGFAVVTGFAGGPVVIYGETKVAGGLQPGWLTMGEAAARLGHHYFWLARRWREEFRLKPRRVGRVLFFREAEIETLIERQAARTGCGGRSKKIIAIVNHGEI